MVRCAILALVVSATLMGCASVTKAPASSNVLSLAEADTGRTLIRSGSLALRVKDLDETKTQIERVVSDVGGRISNWSLRDAKWLNMKLHVPESRLNESMDRIATLGKVVGRSLESRDVTEELIDLEARLRNLLALRDRLRSYLAQASNLEEILAVERELARVQTEIESTEAKLKVLRDQVAMSELLVRVTKKRWW